MFEGIAVFNRFLKEVPEEWKDYAIMLFDTFSHTRFMGIESDELVELRSQYLKRGGRIPATIESIKKIFKEKKCFGIVPIKWSEPKEPDKNYHYNYVVGETPIGDIIITWKDWDECPAYDVCQDFCGKDLTCFGSTKEEVMDAVEKFYENKVRSLISNEEQLF